MRRGVARVGRRANPGVVFNLGFNNARPLTRDVRVWQAAQAAINRAEIASAVFPGGTRPAASVLSRTAPCYTDLSKDLAYDQSVLSALRRSTAHGRSSWATARLNGLASERSSAAAAGPSVM